MGKLQSEFFRKHPDATLKDFQSDVQINTSLEKSARDWIVYQVGGAADAIRYLVDHGARVINISGAVPRHLVQPLSESSWRKLEEAVEYAVEKDVVIVLAAGNNAQRWDDYPGTAETVIVAGASKLDDIPWFQEDVLHGTKIRQGSNSGKRLTAMAPVQDLVVCIPHEPRFYQNDDGPMGPSKVPFKETHDVLPIGATSAAAPIVAAPWPWCALPARTSTSAPSSRSCNAAAMTSVCQALTRRPATAGLTSAKHSTSPATGSVPDPERTSGIRC